MYRHEVSYTEECVEISVFLLNSVTTSNIFKTLDIDKEFITNTQQATGVILTVRRNLQFYLIYICILKFLNEIT